MSKSKSLPFLVELLCEEIPSPYQESGVRQFADNLRASMQKSRLDFDGDDIVLYSTPRRLAVLFGRVALASEEFREEIKGPRVSSPEAALEGFLRKYNIKDKKNCFTKKVKDDEFYFIEVSAPSKSANELLPRAICEACYQHAWAKSMRFGGQDFTWVRPLRNILAILGDKCLAGALNLGGEQAETLAFSDHSYSHRVLGNKPIAIKSAQDYQKQLLDKGGVMVCVDERRQAIEQALQARPEFTASADKRLLHEVANLVEYPHVAIGDIDKSFMALPEAVLISVMQGHQKYIPLYKDNVLAPHFAFVANVSASDEIIRGNKRVLKARLQDAEFLFNEDLQIPLADYVDRLKQMNYFDGLGTMHDKALRLPKLAAKIAPLLAVDVEVAEATAYVLKADLMTEMVGEFPELQGIMGGEYARRQGIDKVQANAIKTSQQRIDGTNTLIKEATMKEIWKEANEVMSHPRINIGKKEKAAADKKFRQMIYDASNSILEPNFPDFQMRKPFFTPTEPLDMVIAVADRLDHLAGFWLIDRHPTGSKDPFALRRSAYEVVRLLAQNRVNIGLGELLGWAIDGYQKPYEDEVRLSLVQFCRDRYKQLLVKEMHISLTLVEAVFAGTDENFDNLLSLSLKIEILRGFLASGTGEGLTQGIKRIANIIKDSDMGEVDSGLLHEPAEQALWQAYLEAYDLYHSDSGVESLVYMYKLLVCVKLSPYIDRFFDEVLVHAEDIGLRNNRLNLLRLVHELSRYFADFKHL